MSESPNEYGSDRFRLRNPAANIVQFQIETCSVQVAAFIKSERPARYPGLTIKYVRGADPVIKLLDEEEEVAEVSSSFFLSTRRS